MMWNLTDFASSAAIICEDAQIITYSELYDATERLAQRMSKRCLIFNLCSNEKGSLLGYVTCINHGIVPLLLDSHIDREMLARLIDCYRPDYLWVPQTMVHEFGYTLVYTYWDYALIKTSFSSEFPLFNELALLLTTSGSTGSPKLVRQSYANIKANTESIVNYLQLDITERPITTLPMSYTYGLSIINSHLYVGASIILTQKTLMQREFWQQFNSFGATSFGGVPYTYEVLDKLRFFRMDLPSLRTMTQAGGKLSPELHRKFAEYAKETGRRFIVMYGQTEATARMAYLPHEKSLEKYGSMGIAIPGGKFYLIDTNGNEILEPGIAGELIYEGANVTLGYAECGNDLAKGDERGGVLMTGDIAQRDAEGYYYIIGRKKRFLKIFGNRVNLDETERMIKSAFGDLDCACTGIDDKMYVFITSASETTQVHRFLLEKTGLNAVAFKVIYIDEIPKNSAGKIQYADLGKYYA